MELDSQAKIDALLALTDELDIAEDILGKRNTPGRTSGFYAGVIKAPGGFDTFSTSKGGKRRKMRGGGLCEDNRFISLAIDSAIILAGATVAVGGAYIGINSLKTFMNAMNFDELIKSIIIAAYELIKALGPG